MERVLISIQIVEIIQYQVNIKMRLSFYFERIRVSTLNIYVSEIKRIRIRKRATGDRFYLKCPKSRPDPRW